MKIAINFEVVKFTGTHSRSINYLITAHLNVDS